MISPSKERQKITVIKEYFTGTAVLARVCYILQFLCYISHVYLYLKSNKSLFHIAIFMLYITCVSRFEDS